MASRLTTLLEQSLASFRSVFSQPDLRRLQLAHATSLFSLWSFSVAVSVYAFEVGGAALVGIVMLVRMAPAALASPFTATLADRYPRERVLMVTDLIRVALTGAAASCVAVGVAPGLTFAITGLLVVVSTAFDPAKNALLPDLVRSPQQLTAANAVGNTFESASFFGGPALGGAMLAVTSVEAAMALSAGLLVLSVAQLARIRPARERAEPGSGSSGSESSPDTRAGAAVAAGFRAIRDDARLRLLVGLLAAQTFVDGILGVLLVVLALDELDLGPGGVGLLDAAVGAGGVAGGFAALSLAARPLVPAFAGGIALWGAPIALIGIVPETAPAVLFLGVVGVGNTLVDVAGLTLLQRAIPDAVRGRVFGVLEGLAWGSVGLGGIAAPGLIELFGLRGALVATGLLLPVAAALTWGRLTRLELAPAPAADELALLRGVPLFAPLAPLTLETLASGAVRVRFSGGESITTQDEPGDRFYVIASGDVEVLEDGVRVRSEGPGEFFGEIAPLRGSVRTATVRALGEVELLAFDGADFVAAVTGHAESARQAEAVVAERLGSARRQLPLL